MLINYIKMALRVMGRKKFFTGITLFGISFTLGILMILISVLETEVGPTQPMSDRDKIVVLPTLQLRQMFYDTIYTVDTTYVNGEMQLDSSFTVDEAGQNNSNSQFAWSYLDRHFREVPHAVHQSFFNAENVYNAYVNGSKIDMRAVYADAGFWDIFDFVFVEGYGFTASSVKQAEPVAIITTKLADAYFGQKEGVLGKTVEMDGYQLKVIGVIEPAGVSLLTNDLVVPHTLLRTVGRGEEIGFGGFMAVFSAATPAGTKNIKDDLKFINSTLEVHPSVQNSFNEVVIRPATYHEIYADQILSLDWDGETGTSLKVMRWILIGIVSFFILLPTLNLINLNVSRILERSSEIGIRKAFGASRTTILSQFIIENVIQTIVGGILGIGLALLGIYLINDAQLMGDIILKINFRFFFFSLLICLLFGVLSGILPALRMSRIQIANAIKQNQL